MNEHNRYNGIMNVYKEAGFTSHDVVAKLRGICQQKKIGHTGTLDPDAVGVLPVCLGNGTKLCDMLTDQTKEYVAEFCLGMTTDTQDITGKILETRQILATEEEIQKCVLSFLGEQQQIPPMYSALKVNGKKLYELARQGREVERKPRPIIIHEIEILETNFPKYKIRVKCSKGTYIRTLCHDIGQALSCGAVMTSLARTKVGAFCMEDSYRLSELEKLAQENRLSEVVTPVDEMFSTLPAATAIKGAEIALHNGNQLGTQMIHGMEPGALHEKDQLRMYDTDGRFCGVYQYDEVHALLKPVKMFL